MTKWGENCVIEWTDKKRYFGLPLSFTRYTLVSSEEWTKLCVKTGWLFTREEEINLYRINDISLSSSLFDKMFKVGSIILHSKDQTNPTFYIVKVKNSQNVRNLIASRVEEEKVKRGFRVAEFG